MKLFDLCRHIAVFCSPAEFSIWTREAGAGGLSIAVEGPSKAEISFEDRKDGSSGVSYVVQEPGGYWLNTVIANTKCCCTIFWQFLAVFKWDLML